MRPRRTPHVAVLATGAVLAGLAVTLPVEVVGRSFSTVGTALYVYALPVAELETGEEVTILPSFINRQVEETTGYVDVWDRGFQMGPESAIVFRFTVWPGMMVQQVDELGLDWQGNSYGGGSSPLRSPVVSLWNWESDGWERLDVGWGRHSIPDAEAYVLPSGAVLLRLETDVGWRANIESLAITIKGRR